MIDAKSLAKTAARWRAGAELVATQPWAPEAYRFYDAQIGISLGDLRLMKRVVLGSEALNEAAVALGIPKDEAEQRLRQGLTGLAAGYEAADKPRPGERADCRCAHCGGVMPATKAA